MGTLIRQASLQLMQLVMERDVEQMLGRRYQQSERPARLRWEKQGLMPHRRAEGAARSTAHAQRGDFQRKPGHSPPHTSNQAFMPGSAINPRNRSNTHVI
jgi:hypothetical protein